MQGSDGRATSKARPPPHQKKGPRTWVQPTILDVLRRRRGKGNHYYNTAVDLRLEGLRLGNRYNTIKNSFLETPSLKTVFQQFQFKIVFKST